MPPKIARHQKQVASKPPRRRLSSPSSSSQQSPHAISSSSVEANASETIARQRRAFTRSWQRAPPPPEIPTSAEAPDDNAGPFREPRVLDDVVYNPSVFRTPVCFELFHRIFSCRVLGGAFIDFASFHSYPIADLFATQGWLPFLFLDELVYPTLCRLFYANMIHTPNQGPFLSTYLFDQLYDLDSLHLSTVLSLPDQGIDIHRFTLETFPYPGSHTAQGASRVLHGSDDPELISSPHSADLLPLPRVIANILAHSILPKNGNRGRYTGCLKLLVYCLMVRLRVNLPLLISNQLIYYTTGPVNLGYGKFITYFFRYHKFAHFSLFSRQFSDTAFTSSNIRLMHLPVQYTGAPPSPPPIFDSPDSSSSRGRSQTRTATIDDIATEVSASENRIIDFMRYHFGHLAQPPFPPPSPSAP